MITGVRAVTMRPSADPSCVLAYDFAEGTGSTVYDLSGKGNHGTIYGAQRVRGRLMHALSYDGVDDYVKVPDSASLDITDEITITSWVKPAFAPGCFHGVVSKFEGTPAGWQFFWHKDGYLYLYANDGVAVESNYDVLTNDLWHHIAVTYKSRSLSGRIYVNGVDETRNVYARTLNANSLDLVLGAKADDITHPFSGILGSTRIYKRILSEDEIKEQYMYGVAIHPRPRFPIFARKVA